jgi:hypothetical protein
MSQLIKKLVFFAASLFAALTLAGCDRAIKEMTTKLTPGQSTGYDVRDVYGTPAMEYKEADGALVWEYPRGPGLPETLMITIAADNKLKSIVNVLTEPYFGQVKPGMSRAEIRRLLGKPNESMVFDLKKEEVWTWRYPEAGGVTMMFNAHLNLDGQVLYTSRLQDQKGG